MIQYPRSVQERRRISIAISPKRAGSWLKDRRLKRCVPLSLIIGQSPTTRLRYRASKGENRCIAALF